MAADADEIDVDGFLDTEESVADLMKSEFASPLDKRGEILDQFAGGNDPDVREQEVSSRDSDLIKRTGMTVAKTDTDGVMLDAEFTPEERAVANHADVTTHSADPVADTIIKATEERRVQRVSEGLSKREMIDLAAEAVDDYFHERVKADGIDEAELNRLKFKARQVVLAHFRKGAAAAVVGHGAARAARQHAESRRHSSPNRRETASLNPNDSARRVYVSDPSDAPEWANLREGPNGGHYYHISDRERAEGGDGGGSDKEEPEPESQSEDDPERVRQHRDTYV